MPYRETSSVSKTQFVFFFDVVHESTWSNHSRSIRILLLFPALLVLRAISPTLMVDGEVPKELDGTFYRVSSWTHFSFILFASSTHPVGLC